MGVVLIEALYAEVHWAFYRAAPLVLLENVYTAALIGMVLVGVEWSVELIRNGLSRAPEDRQRWLRRVLLLAVSATLFVLTRNLWLLIGLHLVLELIWKAWLGRLVHHPIETAATPIDPRLAVDDVRRQQKRRPEKVASWRSWRRLRSAYHKRQRNHGGNEHARQRQALAHIRLHEREFLSGRYGLGLGRALRRGCGG